MINHCAPKNKSNTPELLRSAHLRSTPGRRAILEVLRQAGTPLSQDQIAGSLPDDTALDKVTIYRALEAFVRAGLVHQAFLQNRICHYELAHRCSKIQCHPHFSCTRCGATHCLPEVYLPLAAGLEKGFVIQRQQVRLEGLCPKCSVHNASR